MKPDQLRAIFDAKQCGVRIVTLEESEALDLVLGVSTELDLEVWTWSATRGVSQAMLADAAPIEGTMNAGAALAWMLTLTDPAMCVMFDLSDHLGDAVVARALRDVLEHFRSQAVGGGVRMSPVGGVQTRPSRLVMIDHREDVPPAIAALTRRHIITPPDDEEIESILRRTLRRLNREQPVTIDINKAELTVIIENLRGLSRRQIEQIVTSTVATDKLFNAADLDTVLSGKREMLKSAGVLEFIDAPTSMDQIGGLTRLKSWLAQRTGAFGEQAKAAGLTPPKGLMLLGVQGAGKSLAAKAIATAWRRPLLRLDPGALFDRYIGESERRLREALLQAEAMSPAILWIDEIEKGFASAASASTDGGLSRRMFGTLLTWMQERTSPVFLVATANDIEALPPELLRKGRFDEIFFVDLPDDATRRQILEIHLKKRKQDPAKFDVAALAATTEGYSGAEIEQGVISALLEAFAEKKPLRTARLLETLRESPPLSVTMREKIDELREWAKGRCVMAG